MSSVVAGAFDVTQRSRSSLFYENSFIRCGEFNNEMLENYNHDAGGGAGLGTKRAYVELDPNKIDKSCKFVFRGRTCQPAHVRIKQFFCYHNVEGEPVKLNKRKIAVCIFAACVFIANLLLPILNPILSVVALAVISFLLTGCWYLTAVLNFCDDNSRTNENRMELQQIFKEHVAYYLPDNLLHCDESDSKFTEWMNAFRQTPDYISWSFVHKLAGSFSFMRNKMQVMHSEYIRTSIELLRNYITFKKTMYTECSAELTPEIILSQLKDSQSAECQRLKQRVQKIMDAVNCEKQAVARAMNNLSGKKYQEQLCKLNDLDEKYNNLRHMLSHKEGLVEQLKSCKPDAFLYIKDMLVKQEVQNREEELSLRHDSLSLRQQSPEENEVYQSQFDKLSRCALMQMGKSLIISQHFSGKRHLSERLKCASPLEISSLP